MFNRYFGKKIEYKEVYVNEYGNLQYKDPVKIDGSLIDSSGSTRGTYSNEWLNTKFIKYKYKYRVNKQLKIGDMVDGGKILNCIPRGFGNRIDFYEASTVKYDNLVITENELTMTCLVERAIDYSDVHDLIIYSQPEEVKTFMLGQKEIFRHREDGEIEAVKANSYLFLQSMNIKSGDKIDGYIVTEVVEYPALEGGINYKEAFICK